MKLWYRDNVRYIALLQDLLFTHHVAQEFVQAAEKCLAILLIGEKVIFVFKLHVCYRR